MASYLSYFTSNSSSAPTQQQYQQAQPATSTWTSTVSSRLASLRKALTKDSEDDDPDYEDCSHVSNVLRAYYTQKGRSHPEWLPPDPKKPVAQTTAQQYGQYGNGYGNQYGIPTHNRTTSAGRGGLSDLWDSGPPQSAAPVMQPQSLRTPRQTPQSLRSSEPTLRPGAPDPYSVTGTNNARPLPSQRAGSFQNTPAANTASKADRLRARLQGGGSGRNSPAPIQFSSDSYGDSDPYNDAPHNDASQGGGGGTQNSSSQNPYNNNFVSGGANSRGFGGSAYRQRPGGPR